VISCEDWLENDPHCVGWSVRLYSQPTNLLCSVHCALAVFVSVFFLYNIWLRVLGQADHTNSFSVHVGCPVLVVQRLRRRAFDQAIAGSISGWGAIKSPRSTQPFIPPGQVNRVPALLAEVKAGFVRLCRVASSIV